mmetsp:Transcript_5792/g.10120  ORF Transcript_5792/g.10120 Transcript_5792/m.10120 type:complete len:705 (+) Transcript_5792:56-2170(+)
MRSLLVVGAFLSAGGVDGCVPLGGFEFKFEADEAGRNLRDGGQVTEFERVVLETPLGEHAKENLRHYASIEHMAGTAGDRTMAEFTVEKMKSFGLEDSKIHTMDSLLSYPISRSLNMFDADGQKTFSAPLSENELEMDPTSHTIWRNMTFLGYSPSGNATAQLVYGNYGRPEDFAELKKRGVNVKGKVVIVRYGKCFRGLKVMNAQDHGASAVLIYSDPEDDGFEVGKVYPEGPWRPETSVQRGSVQFNSLCGGDPARAASSKSPEEICGYKQEEMIPQIPVIPISYGDATPLLKSLGGEKVPRDWIGGLSRRLTYRFGPSKGMVEVVTNNTFVTTPIWNVITTIPGTLPEELDQPVIVGNHRDAWVFGAADPNSGSSIILEVGRTLGELLKTGWKPKRTIVIGSWSGEEYGLLGSTGWAEEKADTLLKKASVYINTDTGVSGHNLKVSASPVVARAVKNVLKKVDDPATGRPLDQVWENKVGTLGSGSDYTVFLDHLGIPSIDLSFSQSLGPYGVYHSIYDSYTWIESQVDPDYKYHTTMAKILTFVITDFSDKQLLPMSLTDLGSALEQYVDTIEKKDHKHKLDLTPLRKSSHKFHEAAVRFHNKEHTPHQKNQVFGLIERSFLDPEGLPYRPWFKHVLQAPGLYLGYDAEVYPGLFQAVSDGNWSQATSQINRISSIIDQAATRLDNAPSAAHGGWSDIML